MTREIRTEASGYSFVVPTIAELAADGRPFEIYCFRPSCRRVLRLSAAEASRRLGALTVEQADQRLTCSACGARGRDGFVQARFLPEPVK